MNRNTRLVAVVAFGAGLMAATAAFAQSETPSAPPASASAQPAPQTQPAPSLLPDASAIKPSDPNFSEPPYSVNAPPDSASSGVYLPGAVLGYAKSAAGCVVIGCDDGPQVGGSAGPAASGAPEPPPAGPTPSDPAPSDTH